MVDAQVAQTQGAMMSMTKRMMEQKEQSCWLVMEMEPPNFYSLLLLLQW